MQAEPGEHSELKITYKPLNWKHLGTLTAQPIQWARTKLQQSYLRLK